MKFFRALFIALLCSPALWASFQPITGSSVTVYAPNNNTTNLPVTVSNTGFNVNNTPSVNQSGTWNVGVNAGTNNIGVVTGSSVTIYSPNNNTTAIPVSVATPYTVIQTTVGVNSSTIAVVNAVGTSLSVTGSSVTILSPNNNTTAIPVSGTFFQTTQPVGIANTAFSLSTTTFNLASQPIYATQTATVTFNGTAQPVTQSGSWSTLTYETGRATMTILSGAAAATSVGYQTNGGSVPVSVINTPAVSQSGTWNIGTLTSLTNALPAGTNNIGVVTGSSVTIYSPNNNTTAIPVSGSFSATGSSVTIYAPNNNTTPIPVSGSFNASTVLVSTAAYGATLPVNGLAIGSLGPNGILQAFSVDVSSNLNVNVVTGAATLASNLTQVGGNSVLTGGTNGSLGVGGLAASTSTASGNPVLMGGVYNQTQATLTEAQVINRLVTKRGAELVATGVDNFGVNLVSIGTAAVVTGTGASGIGIPRVTISNDSTLAANQTVDLNRVGGSAVVTGGVNGTQGVGGTAANNASVTGNPLQIGVVTSSTALPTANINSKIMYATADNLGRLMVTGVPWGVISTTSALNMAFTTAENLLVSSAAAGNYTYLCGCQFNNTSATAIQLSIYQTTSPFVTANNTAFVPYGVPASNAASETVGKFDCSQPFFRSKSGGQITIQASAAVLSVPGYCTYYQAP